MILTFHIKKVNSKYKWLMDFKRLITGMFFTGFLISLQAQEKSNYYVICNKQNNATLNEKMLKEIHRVLNSNGVYICITYGVPDNRLVHFNRKEYDWTVFT